MVQCYRASLSTVLKTLKCAIRTHDCHKKADCINTLGDYECYCRYGYATVAMGKGLVLQLFNNFQFRESENFGFLKKSFKAKTGAEISMNVQST